MGGLGVMGILGAVMEPQSYQAIGWILLGLAGLAMAVNQVLKIVDRMKEKPVPAETYMTKEACRAMHANQDERVQHVECELRTVRDEFRTQFTEMNRLAEERIVAVHNRVNDLGVQLAAAVGEIKGEIKRIK